MAVEYTTTMIVSTILPNLRYFWVGLYVLSVRLAWFFGCVLYVPAYYLKTMDAKTFPKPPQNAIIIDDELDTCLLVGMVLKRFGIVSLRAHSLAEGLQKTEQEQPTFIFLDNNLPDGVGIDQIASFRKIAPSSKLFMITAMAHLRSFALQSGADGFVEKPLDLQKIVALVS